MSLVAIFQEITKIHDLCNDWEKGNVADRDFHRLFVQFDVNALMSEHFQGAFDEALNEDCPVVKAADASLNALDAALERVLRIEHQIDARNPSSPH